MIANVALPLALPKPLSYTVPDEFKARLEVGCRVTVPLGKSKFYTGVVISIESSSTNQKLKEIIDVLDYEPLFKELNLEFLFWISEYYCCTIGEVLNAALPSLLRPSSHTEILWLPGTKPPPSLFADELIFVLQKKGKLSLEEIVKKRGLGGAKKLIQELEDGGKIRVNEEVDLQQDQKKEITYRLNQTYQQDLTLLQTQLDGLVSAPKQQEAMLQFLSLLQNRNSEKLETEKAIPYARLKTRGISSSILQTLVKKGLLRKQDAFVERSLPSWSGQKQKLKELSKEQNAAKEQCEAFFSEGKPVLLHGVTGSGKTEIYAHLIKEHLDHKKQILYLLPEIALTNQLIARLSQYFGDQVFVYHSKYTNANRGTTFRTIAQGEPALVIGARSAVFLPFKNLGLVIVDEEHDGSFKQQDPAPRYHGRDAATYLARLFSADFIAGTATPSLEYYYLSKEEKFGYVPLEARFASTAMPEVQLVKINRSKQVALPISEPLKEMTEALLTKGEQVIYFQNRRGYSPYLECWTCNHIPYCENCDVSLHYHQSRERLVCHYCGFQTNVPRICPDCGDSNFHTVGTGTERVEESIQQLFPTYNVARLDTDTAKGIKSLQSLLDDFNNREYQLLVGTQMVTKGLDFDHVTGIGIIDADSLLYHPDFRAIEKTFQLITQVSGRAGRRDKPGKVIIQTAQPEHPFYEMLLNHGMEAVYEKELEERSKYFYPPFSRIISITIKDKDYQQCYRVADVISKAIRKHTGPSKCLGPVAPPVARINNYHLQQILVKGSREKAESKHFKKVVATVVESYRSQKGFSTKIIINVDP